MVVVPFLDTIAWERRLPYLFFGRGFRPITPQGHDLVICFHVVIGKISLPVSYLGCIAAVCCCSQHEYGVAIET